MLPKLKEANNEFRINATTKLNIFTPTFIIAEIGINHEGNISEKRDRNNE